MTLLTNVKNVLICKLISKHTHYKWLYCHYDYYLYHVPPICPHMLVAVDGV